MFNRRNKDLELVAFGAALNPPKTEYITKNVEIKEHRAPTDESIRLAKEYEEKIWHSISSRIIQDIKDIDAQFIICEPDYLKRKKRLLFKINGRKIDVRLSDDYTEKDIIKEVIKNISEAIAVQLFGNSR